MSMSFDFGFDGCESSLDAMAERLQAAPGDLFGGSNRAPLKVKWGASGGTTIVELPEAIRLRADDVRKQGRLVQLESAFRPYPAVHAVVEPTPTGRYVLNVSCEPGMRTGWASLILLHGCAGLYDYLAVVRYEDWISVYIEDRQIVSVRAGQPLPAKPFEDALKAKTLDYSAVDAGLSMSVWADFANRLTAQIKGAFRV